jgi:adenine-specific DNA-methyltransferase
MQGNAFQIDKEPLLEIPIFKPSEKEETKIATIVDKIITLKKAGKSTTDLEEKIDEEVYKLYDLSPEEIKLVEGKKSK